ERCRRRTGRDHARTAGRSASPQGLRRRRPHPRRTGPRRRDRQRHPSWSRLDGRLTRHAPPPHHDHPGGRHMSSSKGGHPNRRKTSKAGPSKGSGGQKKGLAGKGRTLKAEDRPWHKSYTGDDKPQRTQWKQAKERAKAAAEGRSTNIGKSKPKRDQRRDEPEMLLGRNPVLEALRARVPAK